MHVLSPVDCFKKTFFQELHQSVKQFESISKPIVGSSLGPNCLKKLSADDTSGQRIILSLVHVVYEDDFRSLKLMF